MQLAVQARQQTVCAIVITYNRLDLLRQCLACLRAQTRPLDAIIVVDNASVDGSAEWLRAQEQLIVVTHEVNSGAAGALHTGIRQAYERGFDWFWFADDDLIVPPDLLDTLLGEAARASLEMANPLVVATDSSSLLAFRLSPTINTIEDATRAAIDGLIENYMNLFNGLLMRRTTIDRIGTIKAEIFMGGEESEYILRARANGVRMATIVRATCSHPRARFSYQPVIFHLGEVEIAPPPAERLWNYVRSLGYINFRYNGIYAVVRDALKYSWYFLVNERFAVGRMCRFLRYYADGVTDRFQLPPSARIQ